MVNVIMIFYTDVQCHFACNIHMSHNFTVKTGLKQGCILSLFLFTVAIDWLTTEITKDGKEASDGHLPQSLKTWTMQMTLDCCLAGTRT